MSVLLTVKDLSFGYTPGNPIFDGATLEVHEGESIGVWSDNGSGKTTLLRCITGLEKRTGGQIFLGGKSIETEADFQQLRRHVGFVLQNPEHQLFFPDVFDDVMFGPRNLGLTDEEAEVVSLEALKSLGAEGLAHSESLCLSGGQKRLVTIASILAMKPEVLLLDEPTTGLDLAARQRLTDLLKCLPQAKIVVSHDFDFLKAVTTRLVTLKHGRIEPLEVKPDEAL